MFDLTKNVDYTLIVALEVAPLTWVRFFSSTNDEVVRVLIKANVTRLIASTVCVSRVEIMEERSCLAGLSKKKMSHYRPRRAIISCFSVGLARRQWNAAAEVKRAPVVLPPEVRPHPPFGCLSVGTCY